MAADGDCGRGPLPGHVRCRILCLEAFSGVVAGFTGPLWRGTLLRRSRAVSAEARALPPVPVTPTPTLIPFIPQTPPPTSTPAPTATPTAIPFATPIPAGDIDGTWTSGATHAPVHGSYVIGTSHLSISWTVPGQGSYSLDANVLGDIRSMLGTLYFPGGDGGAVVQRVPSGSASGPRTPA